MEGELGFFSVGDRADAVVSRGGVDVVPDGIKLDLSGLDLANLGVGGQFIIECFDRDGNLRWEDTAENGVTDAGIASLLNVYLGAQTQITAWYIGLIDNNGFTSLASGDTMTSHTGWSEMGGTNYSNATRPAWTPGAASGGAVVNATTANFSMTPASTVTVKGLFLVSDSTKGGTAGTLFSTAVFSGGTQSCNNGDTLKVTYTVSATSS